MWEDIRQHLLNLKQYDKRCIVFGSSQHHYRLNPSPSSSELRQAEEKLGVPLPQSLHEFYRQIGNGDAGPNYGIFRLKQLASELVGVFEIFDDPVNLALLKSPYLGRDYYYEIAKRKDSRLHGDGLYDPTEQPAGLLPISELGCDGYVCIVVSGPNIGNVTYFHTEHGVIDKELSFVEYYRKWVTAELSKFKRMTEQIASNADLETIACDVYYGIEQNDPNRIETACAMSTGYICSLIDAEPQPYTRKHATWALSRARRLQHPTLNR